MPPPMDEMSALDRSFGRGVLQFSNQDARRQ
jgi:hypothetical protein